MESKEEKEEECRQKPILMERKKNEMEEKISIDGDDIQ